MDRVFVYGSLRPGRDAFGVYLAGAARAVTPAILVDHALFGRGLPYPFVRSEPGRRVVGELVEIGESDAVLARLDAYEGDEYIRARVVVDADGSQIEAWTYLAAPGVSLGEETLVASGVWDGR